MDVEREGVALCVGGGGVGASCVSIRVSTCSFVSFSFSFSCSLGPIMPASTSSAGFGTGFGTGFATGLVNGDLKVCVVALGLITLKPVEVALVVALRVEGCLKLGDRGVPKRRGERFMKA